MLWGEPGLKGAILIGERRTDSRASFHWDLAYLGGDSAANHAWADSASKEELHKRAVELTAHLPAYFADAVKQTGPDGVVKPPIKLIETVLPMDVPPSSPVTLVGDSAHSMVPFRGMGANTSLLDACELATAIIDGVKHSKTADEVLRPYEERMIPRGRTKVLESREVAESDSNFDVSGGRLEKVNAS